VYNEARTVERLIESVLAVPMPIPVEVVAVDDGSSDSSLEILRRMASRDDRVNVIAHERNRGKAAALHTAIDAMTGTIAIVQDADLEYDPAEIPRVIRPILEERADAVFGSRFAASPERRVLLYWHSLGNRILTWFTNVLNDLNLTDMETCYKAVRADVLRSLNLSATKFGVEPELTTRLAQWGARIYEVPISYHGRSYAEGKKVGWRDGFHALGVLFHTRFVNTGFSKDAGHSTLESLKGSGPMSRWILSQFPLNSELRVFEAGCGIGNLSTELLDISHLTAVDISKEYISGLQRRYGHLSNVDFRTGDLETIRTLPVESAPFDAVLCVNVLEHLRNPASAMDSFCQLLAPGGVAMLLVPAHDWLFSAADRALDHQFRYSERAFRQLIEESGLEIETLRPFNRLGVAGWWLNKISGRTRITPLQARVFGFIIPLAKLVERAQWLPGLSWVAIARKPA
jgi:glycosyltransferase involved in cell wall biosynthesis